MAAAGVRQHPGRERGRRRRTRSPRRPRSRGHADLVIAVDDAAEHRRPVGGDDRGGQPGRRPGRPGRRHGPLRRAVARAGAGAGPAGARRARDWSCAASRPTKVTACSSRTATPGVRLATRPWTTRPRSRNCCAPTACPPRSCRPAAPAPTTSPAGNPAVTELQAGSYVFMDAFHGSLVPGFAVSLTVLTTVLARHGDTVIFDAGRKSIGIDFVLAADPGLRLRGPVLRRGARAVRHRSGIPGADRRSRAADLRIRADDGQPARRHLRHRRRPGHRRVAGLPARAGALGIPDRAAAGRLTPALTNSPHRTLARNPRSRHY